MAFKTVFLAVVSKRDVAVFAFGDVTAVMRGRISIDSPVGKALLRKRKGDAVTVSCPDGSSYTLKILKIS